MMKKLISTVLVMVLAILHAQVLKVTPDGLQLVKDSVSNTPITTTLFQNFKGDYRYIIRNDNNWMIRNSGKYFFPKIEVGSYIVLQNDGKWGAIQLNGEIKIPFEFNDPITFFKNGECYGVYAKGQSGTFGLGGENASYEGDYQVRDWKGNVVAAFSEMIDDHKGCYLMLGKEPDLCGIINDRLDTLVKFQYSCTSWDTKNFGFSDRGFVALRNTENKCGVMSYKGKTVMPFSYDYIDDLVFPTAILKKDGKYGLLNNKDLKLKVPLKYDDIQCSSNASLGDYFSAFAKDSTSWDVYDSAFKRVGRYTFEEITTSVADPTLVQVKENGKYGLYNFIKNSYVFVPRYDEIEMYCMIDCNQPNYVLYKGDSIKVIDHTGKTKNVFIGLGIDNLYYEYAKLKMKDGSFRILKNLQFFLPDTFQTVQMIVESTIPDTKLFIAKKNQGSALLSEAGKIILPYEYDKIEGWMSLGNKSYLAARLKGKTYMYNTSLELLNTDGFDELPISMVSVVNETRSGSVIAKINSKYGGYDLDKKTFVVPPIYDSYELLYLDPANWLASEIWTLFTSGQKIYGYNVKLEKVFEVEGQKILNTNRNDMFILQNGDLSSLIKNDGTAISKGYESIESLKNTIDLVVIKSKGKYGCMDLTGKIVIPVKYDAYCNSADMYSYFGWAFSFKQKKMVYRYGPGTEILWKGETEDPFCY